MELYSDEYFPLWNTLSKIDCSNNAQDFWKTMKKFRRKNSDEAFPNVMMNGTTKLTTKISIKHAIGQYFSEVSLNQDTEATLFKQQFFIPEQQVTKPVSLNHTLPHGFTKEEISDSIQHQQNHKKGGPDNTTNESFKNLPDHMQTKLCLILNACLNLRVTPESWQSSLTKLIHKKGSALEIMSYTLPNLGQPKT